MSHCFSILAIAAILNLFLDLSWTQCKTSYFETGFYQSRKSELDIPGACKDTGISPDIYHNMGLCPNHFASREFARLKCCQECKYSTLWRVTCEGRQFGQEDFPENVRLQFKCFYEMSHCSIRNNYTWAQVEENFKVYCEIGDEKPPTCPAVPATAPVQAPTAPTYAPTPVINHVRMTTVTQNYSYIRKPE